MHPFILDHAVVQITELGGTLCDYQAQVTLLSSKANRWPPHVDECVTQECTVNMEFLSILPNYIKTRYLGN